MRSREPQRHGGTKNQLPNVAACIRARDFRAVTGTATEIESKRERLDNKINPPTNCHHEGKPSAASKAMNSALWHRNSQKNRVRKMEESSSKFEFCFATPHYFSAPIFLTKHNKLMSSLAKSEATLRQASGQAVAIQLKFGGLPQSASLLRNDKHERGFPRRNRHGYIDGSICIVCAIPLARAIRSF